MGLSSNRSFPDKNTWGVQTAFVICFNNYFYLNGKAIYARDGKNGEKLTRRVDLTYFRKKNSEIDIYVDADEGIMRIKSVGTKDADNHEVEMLNINNSNKDGWVPHFVFEQSKDCPQKIRIARINPSWYGQQNEIKW